MRFMKSMVAGLAAIIGAVSFAGTAQADRWRGYGLYDRGYHANYRGYRHRPYYRYPHYRYDRDYYGGAVAAGVLGFATGAIVGGAVAAPRYYAPGPYYAPGSARYSGGATSGTAAWIAACQAKYRSFNPSTGMYLGYDGDYHRCQL